MKSDAQPADAGDGPLLPTWAPRVSRVLIRRLYESSALGILDGLIHLIHDERGGGSKPGAYAFIEGEISDVAAFLDHLAYGLETSAEIMARRDHWRTTVRKAKRFWRDQLGPPDGSPCL